MHTSPGSGGPPGPEALAGFLPPHQLSRGRLSRPLPGNFLGLNEGLDPAFPDIARPPSGRQAPPPNVSQTGWSFSLDPPPPHQQDDAAGLPASFDMPSASNAWLHLGSAPADGSLAGRGPNASLPFNAACPWQPHLAAAAWPGIGPLPMSAAAGQTADRIRGARPTLAASRMMSSPVGLGPNQWQLGPRPAPASAKGSAWFADSARGPPLPAARLMTQHKGPPQRFFTALPGGHAAAGAPTQPQDPLWAGQHPSAAQGLPVAASRPAPAQPATPAMSPAAVPCPSLPAGLNCLQRLGDLVHQAEILLDEKPASQSAAMPELHAPFDCFTSVAGTGPAQAGPKQPAPKAAPDARKKPASRACSEPASRPCHSPSTALLEPGWPSSDGRLERARSRPGRACAPQLQKNLEGVPGGLAISWAGRCEEPPCDAEAQPSMPKPPDMTMQTLEQSRTAACQPAVQSADPQVTSEPNQAALVPQQWPIPKSPLHAAGALPAWSAQGQALTSPMLVDEALAELQSLQPPQAPASWADASSDGSAILSVPLGEGALALPRSAMSAGHEQADLGSPLAAGEAAFTEADLIQDNHPHLVQSCGLHIQHGWPGPAACNPEAADFLARIGLQVPGASTAMQMDDGADPGASRPIRKSARPSKPVKRQADSITLPDTEEGDDEDPPAPSEAGQAREKKRTGRKIEPVTKLPGQEEFTESQQRLLRRRSHNRESARRSRTRRQVTADEQATQVEVAEAKNQQLTEELTKLQWQCCNYSLQLQELHGKHAAALSRCHQLTRQLEALTRQPQAPVQGTA